MAVYKVCKNFNKNFNYLEISEDINNFSRELFDQLSSLSSEEKEKRYLKIKEVSFLFLKPFFSKNEKFFKNRRV